jgi:hypothetical protein
VASERDPDRGHRHEPTARARQASRTQADIDRLLDTMDKVTDSGQTMVHAYQALDIETTNTARLELQGAIDDMQRQMAELGLKRCLTI